VQARCQVITHFPCTYSYSCTCSCTYSGVLIRNAAVGPDHPGPDMDPPVRATRPDAFEELAIPSTENEHVHVYVYVLVRSLRDRGDDEAAVGAG